MVKVVADAVFQVAELVDLFEPEDQAEILDCVIKNLQAIRDSSIIINGWRYAKGDCDAED